MKYKDSSLYVQRQTDAMLKSFKKFIKTYVDNIIIYSRILIEHVIHLIKIFDLFRIKRINLAFIKSYLKYSSITLLGQKVDSLNMFISAEKIVVIIALHFSNNLKKIDHFLDLIEYLRSSILKYAQRINSLQEKKITFIRQLFNIKKSFKKRETTKMRLQDSIHDKIHSFKNLQSAFNEFQFLIHFNKLRRLYIDLNAFKQ